MTSLLSAIFITNDNCKKKISNDNNNNNSNKTQPTKQIYLTSI